ncbi:MAG: proprotein convertase P-domain-containing protein [Deltaproteobacteria bacterium]|nr:proprotein convertase P-domain-containing protein [Deltaproteobacteria bacterium]
MRIRLLATALVALPLFAACATTDGDEGPSPYDDDYPVSSGDINAGAPANDSLPDDNKADAHYPATFELADQSPVKSQGSRGVCSIFSATAQIENLYIKGGMPVADADFSEQYLQWASKRLAGGFPSTEGSTSDINLRTTVQFGTVKEAVWPYQIAPWNATNDPACVGGENQPTQCYTNGEPPTESAQAEKFKLPSSRWVNTNSMKAHMTTKQTGVNVGLTFFYQSWNHRKSALPVSTDYWQKGYVTYPNADDKTKSLETRAGHAIHLIGWDDNLEVAMRDKDGNPVLDAQGNPRTEKGFWLFKNSWGTAGFGINHPTGAGYGWISYKYVAEYGSAVTAEVPTLGGGGGGGGTGGTPRSYNAAPAAAIPDNSPAGVSNTINVTDTGALGEVKVTVDISHSYAGDLKVSLVKGTTEKVLSANVGGSADDIKKTFTVAGLEGQALAGGWTLKIVDNAAQDVGTLNSWKLDVTTR